MPTCPAAYEAKRLPAPDLPKVDLHRIPFWVVKHVRQADRHLPGCKNRCRTSWSALHWAQGQTGAGQLFDHHGQAQYPGEPFKAMVSEPYGDVDRDQLAKFCYRYRMIAEVSNESEWYPGWTKRIIFRPLACLVPSAIDAGPVVEGDRQPYHVGNDTFVIGRVLPEVASLVSKGELMLHCCLQCGETFIAKPQRIFCISTCKKAWERQAWQDAPGPAR